MPLRPAGPASITLDPGATIERELGATDGSLDVTAPGAADSGMVAEVPVRAAQIGRFIVLRRIGAGGMGVVYLAYDNALDRRVAVKLIRGPSPPDRETTARMRREAQAMARLSHPNVLQIYEAGESEGSVYLAMEYVRGGSLAAWLARRGAAGTLDRRTIVAMFVQAGRGLQAAHQAGLVHRDFKPENVLVGDDEVARVGDFGLVRGLGDDEPGAARSDVRGPLLATTLTATRGVMGTPAYMSPEQHAGLPTDARTDQFSFCVALWEALHGERPFAGETLAELAEAIDRGTPRQPGVATPTWLRAALVRGLALEPARRWASMAELLAVLSDDPDARRRRRVGWGVGALAVVGTIAGLGLANLAGQQEVELATRRAADEGRRAERSSEERDRALLTATREAGRARDTLRMAALRDIGHDPTRAALLLQEVEAPDSAPEWTPRALATLAAPISAAVLRGHKHVVDGVGFIGADEQRVITAANDRTVRVWRRDGLGDPQVLVHAHPLDGVVVSPDRRRFVSLGDTVARVWEVRPGEPVVALAELPGPGRSERAAFTADGLRLATVDRGGNLRLWELASGRLLAELGQPGRVLALAFDATGQRLRSVDGDGVVLDWGGAGEAPLRRPSLGPVAGLRIAGDLSLLVRDDAGVAWWWREGRAPLQLRGHTAAVTGAAQSPDGRELATAARDGSVRLWERASGRELARLEHDGPVEGVVYSPDGRWLASFGASALLLWQRDDLRRVHELRGHGDAVGGAVFSSDGSHLLTHSDEHEPRVWDLRGLGDTRVFRTPPGGVDRAYGGCDVGRVVTLGADGALRVWACAGGEAPTTIQLGAPPIYGFELDAGATRAAFVDERGVWDLELPAGAPRRVGVHPRMGWRVARSPDGRHLVSTGYDRTARVWSLTGDAPPIVLAGHESPVVWAAAWRPDGAAIATIANDQSVRIWPIGPVLGDSSPRPAELAASQVFTGHARGAKSVAWSPDGARVLTSSPDGSARIWDPAGVLAPVVLAEHRGAVLAAAWSPDGGRVATACEDGAARVWPTDGVSPPLVLRGHRDEVVSVAWHPDGAALVTASADGTARVWLAASGLTSDVHDAGAPVDSARFTGDGEQVLLVVGDAEARLWRPDLRGEHDSAALQARLRAVTSSCLTARERELLLLEDAAAALATHTACEARHGRTPDVDEGVLRRLPQAPSSSASASPAGVSQSKAG